MPNTTHSSSPLDKGESNACRRDWMRKAPERRDPCVLRLVGKALCAALLAAAIGTPYIHAQEACHLTHLKEQHSPDYPLGQESNPIAGTIELEATFTPQGRVSATHVLAGPQTLRFESEAYVRGWRVDPTSEQRQCLIRLEYRFDSSPRICSFTHPPTIHAEHIDDTDVVMHISCDSL